MRTVLVTGGCGFIGSHFVLQQIEAGNRVINLDSMSYAADARNVAAVSAHELYRFVEGSILDAPLLSRILAECRPDAVVHFAAESHVDNSIAGPEVFVETNVMGTCRLLWASLAYWQGAGKPDTFRFLHVSTDEVFGQLPLEGHDKFSEITPYSPSSPYSASKAASDHLVRAWHHTYGLPVLVTNCSNNYGPHQHREKLIPTIIRTAIAGQALPVYGQGLNVRDWIYVEDHCRGIGRVLDGGAVGQTYCLGGQSERRNIDVVHRICDILDELRPKASGSYRDQISFVTDRLGHDLRYAINDTKARQELGFETRSTFEERLRTTIIWYLDHADRLS